MLQYILHMVPKYKFSLKDTTVIRANYLNLHQYPLCARYQLVKGR